MATTNTPPTLNIFKKNRIAIESLLLDTINYTVNTFKQGRTNFTVASAFGQIVFVTQNIAQLILYYIEDSITELNISTATRTNSVMGLVTLAGHNPTRAISATGEIKLSTKSTVSQDLPGSVIVVPNFTRIKCQNNGLEYVLTLPSDDVRISPSGNNGQTFMITQGSIETQIFTGTGGAIQSFGASAQQSAQIDNFFVNVYVNGEKWTKYDSLYDIPRNAKGYLVKTGVISGIDVYFGNANFGLIPSLGDEIRIEYLVSSGETGTVQLTNNEDASYTWVDGGFTIYGDDVDLNESFDIHNVNAPDFGSNPEPLALTRLIGPKTSRSMVLANPDNYIIFLEKFNLFSIIDAYATPGDNNINDDNVIYIFLIPDIRKRLKSNEDYFSVEEGRFFLNTYQENKILKLIADSRSQIVTTVVKIVEPIVSRFVINIAIIVFNGYSEDSIKLDILQRLSDYFISIRRRDRIPRSDLISIIENIEGVDSVNMNIVSEKDEIAQIKWQSLTPAQKVLVKSPKPIGLDEFGDIIIKAKEIPIIRGGWKDRNGISYESGITADKPSAVNIIVKDVIATTYNTQFNNKTKINIKN